MRRNCGGRALADANLEAVRALIAREILDLEHAPASLGGVTLHPHQQRAAVRVRQLLRAHGGALLADPTGLGKTFVALVVAARYEHPLIICPAVLRDNWRSALIRVGRSAEIVSFERLSRGLRDLARRPDLVIVDESHHLRNPHTKRYDGVASLCDRAHVVLLSATPVQNRRDDLDAQLALFLGDAVRLMTDVELGRFVVRRDVGDSSARLPTVVGPRWIALGDEDDILDDLMRLPPATPLADEGEAHALLRYSLLRQWSSSRAALVAGLRGRLARGVALIAALDAGLRPTRRELAAWSHTEDAVQLALPELVVPSGSGNVGLRVTRRAVERHVSALRAVLDRLRCTPDPDPGRAGALREIRRQHPDARVLAFSQYAQTVRAIAGLLMRRDPGVAELTARGARVAGGRVGRDAVLGQFSPLAPVVPSVEQVDLLVTTDVSSEGLDLQRASVIVHLDLPWNPARLEQRVGRVRRLGGPNDRVFVYALAPPAPTERVLDVERRLRAKLRIAAQLVGIGVTALPDGELDAPEAAPLLTSDLHKLLASWCNSSSCAAAELDQPFCAAVQGPIAGCLALVIDGEERMLVADDGAGPTDDPRALQRLAVMACGPATLPASSEIATATSAIAAWAERRTAREQIRVFGPESSRARARIAGRLARLVASAPRHSRGRWAAAASMARLTLATQLGVGAERRLAMLGDATVADEQWLAAVAEIGAGRAAHHGGRHASVAALIVVRGAASSEPPPSGSAQRDRS